MKSGPLSREEIAAIPSLQAPIINTMRHTRGDGFCGQDRPRIAIRKNATESVHYYRGTMVAKMLCD